MRAHNLSRIRRAISSSRAHYLLMSDGEPLCIPCVIAQWPLIASSYWNGDLSSGWHPYGVEVEPSTPDTGLVCAHCNAPIC